MYCILLNINHYSLYYNINIRRLLLLYILNSFRCKDFHLFFYFHTGVVILFYLIGFYVPEKYYGIEFGSNGVELINRYSFTIEIWRLIENYIYLFRIIFLWLLYFLIFPYLFEVYVTAYFYLKKYKHCTLS